MAQAAYTVTLAQVGTDVVATGGGTIDLTGLSLVVSGAVTNAGCSRNSLGQRTRYKCQLACQLSAR
jgi:hypothetical protein